MSVSEIECVRRFQYQVDAARVSDAIVTEVQVGEFRVLGEGRGNFNDPAAGDFIVPQVDPCQPRVFLRCCCSKHHFT